MTVDRESGVGGPVVTWEYKIVYGLYLDVPELNALGGAGWELAAFNRADGDNHHHYIFKKERHEPVAHVQTMPSAS